jgi:PAS domain S-box-containing protein
MKKTPLKIAATVASIAFLCEVLVMMLLHRVNAPHNYLILLDSFLMVLFLSPALYYFIYRPLRESEERNRSLVNSMNEGVYLHEVIYDDTGMAVDYRILDVNPSFEKITGLKKETSTGRRASDLYGSNDPPYLDIYAKVASTGEPAYFETYFPPMDKHFRISAFSPERGRFATVFADITQSKQLRKKLVTAKKEWEETFDIINDAITIHDRDFNIVRCNKAAEEMLGVPYEKMLKRKCYESYHGKSCPPEGCPSCTTLQTGEPSVTEVFEPHLNKHIEIKALPKFDENNQLAGLVHVVQDIDSRKKAEKARENLEAQLRQSQKMEAIGTMAGGIAHDFNNILAVIMGNAELSMDELREEDPARSNAIEILEAANRAKDLVSQILSFSRKEDVALVPVMPHQLVGSAVKLMTSTIPKTVEVRLDIDPHCGFIRADITQMHQVMMNLSTNAVHAMDEKGVLEISLKKVAIGPDDQRYRQRVDPGSYALLTVSDTGIGMDEKTANRIFDPFFTTKEKGEGTGMGLSVVYGIVKNHGGVITVDSKPGKGSVFSLLFPAIEGKALPKREEDRSLPGGNERILYVDDERKLADVSRRMLENQGYQVTVSTDSAGAVGLLMSDPDRFDLVITDQTMPGMSGTELTAELLKINPDIPVILCTGFSNKISVERAKAMGISEFCMKPLDWKHMAVTIRKVLDERRRLDLSKQPL